ncbi:MAG: hypothetical protein SPJ70_01715 [Candidatus Borkfalkiaceae bacterium]|nr:hypothetical protein [Christensenellaceae bacterium]
MKKFIRVAAVALAIVAALGLFGCKKSKADYSHSWRVVAYKASGEVQAQRVGFKVTKKTDKQIKQIWVRVDGFDKGVKSVDLTVDRYTSSSNLNSANSYNKVEYKLKNEKKGCKATNTGWFKVVDDWDYTSTSSSVYVRLTLNGGVTIGEVGFVDEEGYKCTFEVNSANVYLQGYENQTTEKQFTKEELTAAQGKTKNGNPLNLADEQKSFTKGKDRK